MTDAECMELMDRMLGAGLVAPTDPDRLAAYLAELTAALAWVAPETAQDAITALIRQTPSHHWPPVGRVVEAIHEVTRGHVPHQDTCPDCRGSRWVEAAPYRANGGHVYQGVTRCRTCGAPPPRLEHLRGQQTPLSAAELREQARPAVVPLTRAEMYERVRALAARRAMPTREGR